MPEGAVDNSFRRSTGSLAGTHLVALVTDGHERLALDAVAQALPACAAGAEMVAAGAKADRLYVVVDGWACRYKARQDGSQQIVALIVPGMIANLEALIFDRADASVRALTRVTAVTLPRADVAALAAHHAGIAGALTRLALIENAILGQRTVMLGRMSAQQRLASFLCEVGERLHPGRGEACTSFILPLTQEMLADTLGLTAVHINRSLQGLRARGLIEMARRTVSLPDLPRLHAFAEFDPSYLHHDRAS